MFTRLTTNMLEHIPSNLPLSSKHIHNGTPFQLNMSTSKLILIQSAETPSSTSREWSFSTRSTKDLQLSINSSNLQTKLAWQPHPMIPLEEIIAVLALTQSVVLILPKCRQSKQALSLSLHWSHSTRPLRRSRLVRPLPLPTMETTQPKSRFR